MPNPATTTPASQASAIPANDATHAFLRDLASKRFWGNLTIKFQGGSVIHITKEESLPADKLEYRMTRGAYDTANS